MKDDFPDEESVRAKKDDFPMEGSVRAKQSATFLGIGLSTYWLWVSQGRIKKPIKHGARVSTWDAKYIRHLAQNGVEELA